MRTAFARGVSSRCSNDMTLANGITLGESTPNMLSPPNGAPLSWSAVTLGERINARLAAVGLSQAELARRVGVRQSTINSLVNSSSRTSRSIVKIARELQTTPAYLMGETDDPHTDAVETQTLSAEQRELLDLYQAMDDASRRSLMHVARSMGGEPLPRSPAHAPKLALAVAPAGKADA